jgi:hypothetical protein
METFELRIRLWLCHWKARMTDFLFADPTFLLGAGRVLDLGASLERFSYGFGGTPAEVDARAIAQDWAAVGIDLAAALEMQKAE